MIDEKIFAIDTETTTSNQGNPFDQTNKLVCYSVAQSNTAFTVFDGEAERGQIQSYISSCDMLVLFNAKFDLHWLNRVGIDWTGKQIWDCQLAEYMLSNQTWRFPDMATTATKYGLEAKIDVVREQYWKKGIDTPDIPREILDEYATHDARLTYDIRLKQLEEFRKRPALYRLFLLHCRDLVLLVEMESSGLVLDMEQCNEQREVIEKEVEELNAHLESFYPDIPINFGSGDQLSAFLYGGVIKEEKRELVGYFKSGKRIGEPRFSVSVVEHQLPRLFEPIKGSELKKEGVYGTSEDLLKKLKGGAKKRQIVEVLLRLAMLRKLLSTYYVGLPTLGTTMNWKENMLYGQYNQCVTVTGRLSSSKPNLQNLSGDSLGMFISRY